MTEAPHWFDLADRLKNEGIAEPVLWLGDDRHYEKAKDVFGESVVKMLTFVHRPYELKGIDYEGEYEEFFKSENYLRAKDRCLKMMDRLDLYGTFSRQDREAYFHKIIFWTLKRFYHKKPDLLLMAEAPHSHAQYLIYEICLFLKIPSFKFNRWMLVPLIFLQNMITGEIIKKTKVIESKKDIIITEKILSFIENLSKDPNNYELSYMKKQRKQNEAIHKISNFFQKDILNAFLDIRHNIANKIKKRHSSINPYNLNFLTRKRIQRLRGKNLLKNSKKYSVKEIAKPYVYFALHYEPERTTNPDGGDYQDQLLAIKTLRSFVPSEVEIIVKEHPSQILNKDRGPRGRSPLFYDLINNIRGVKQVDTDMDNIELIKNAELTATITGTVALEASILGSKAITFGSTWFPGCPNIIPWEESLNYEELKDIPIRGKGEVKEFLLNFRKEYAVIGCQNGSVMRRFSYLINKDFKEVEKEGVFSLVKTLMRSI